MRTTTLPWLMLLALTGCDQVQPLLDDLGLGGSGTTEPDVVIDVEEPDGQGGDADGQAPGGAHPSEGLVEAMDQGGQADTDAEEGSAAAIDEDPADGEAPTPVQDRKPVRKPRPEPPVEINVDRSGRRR